MTNEDRVIAIVDQLLSADPQKPGPTFRRIAARIVKERAAIVKLLRARGVDAETIAAVKAVGVTRTS